jgi:flagellar hook assembly protein FlgD
VTGVGDQSGGPASGRLRVTCAPNPFRPSTTVAYSLGGRARVSLEVYDVLGRRVRTLVDRIEVPGAHQVMWDGTDARGSRLASGVYSVRLEAGGRAAVAKIVLLR